MEFSSVFILMLQHYVLLTVCVFMFMHSVKYEDPQALGGLASALDVRQQNTGGVSTPKHAVSYSE